MCCLLPQLETDVSALGGGCPGRWGCGDSGELQSKGGIRPSAACHRAERRLGLRCQKGHKHSLVGGNGRARGPRAVTCLLQRGLWSGRGGLMVIYKIKRGSLRTGGSLGFSVEELGESVRSPPGRRRGLRAGCGQGSSAARRGAGTFVGDSALHALFGGFS